MERTKVRANHTIRRAGLARALSKLGYCSRSHAAELIRAGRVSLNGNICRDPEAPVSGKLHQIAVDEKLVEARKKIYLMMNKPRGVVTTAFDEEGRETVYTILNRDYLNQDYSGKTGSTEKEQAWVAPVGRLDKASEGLLLLTNDSKWGARIAAPETHLDKTYHVQIAIVPNEAFIHALVRGVKVKQAVELLRVKQARPLRAGKKNCWIEIVLDEGKNRQIRRIMESLSVEVLRLVRVAIGPLQLGDLPRGQHRSLTATEKQMLDRALQGKT